MPAAAWWIGAGVLALFGYGGKQAADGVSSGLSKAVPILATGAVVYVLIKAKK